MGNITMKKVAKQAGVSVMTVSRVVNGFPYVSDKVAEKVRSAMSEVGYDPRRRRRVAIPKDKTGDIGLLLIGATLDYLRLPLYSAIISKIESVLAEEGYRLVLTQVPDMTQLPVTVSPSKLDGALVIGGRFAQPSMRGALRRLNSVMLLGSHGRNGKSDSWGDWVSSDYYASGQLAAQYLVERGHRIIAYLNPMPTHPGFREVAEGFERCGQESGAEVVLLVDGPSKDIRSWDRKKGKVVVEALVRQCLSRPAAQRPTGIHIANDEICTVAYPVIMERGLVPGKDLEVIGRGNEESFLSMLHPRPASIDLNAAAITRRAVSSLFYRMSHPEDSVYTNTVVAPRIVAADTEWSSEQGVKPAP